MTTHELRHYDIGDPAPIEANFTVDGVPTDPTSVTFKVRDPSGNVEQHVWPGDPEIAHPSPGRFIYTIDTDEIGIWHARYDGEGAADAGDEVFFIVDPSAFHPASLAPRAFASIVETKLYMDPDDPTDTTRDWIIARLIEAASEELELVSGREIVAYNASRDANANLVVPLETRVYDGREVEVDTFAIDDLAELVSVTVDGAAVVAGDIETLPRARRAWAPIEQIRLPRTTIGATGRIEVRGRWGFPAIPPALRQKTMEVVDFWTARDLTKYSETYVNETGQLQIPRSLPQPAFDTARTFRRRRVRLASLRVGG